ncbi:hypothetical protein BJY04DRAFT_212537 [Aspergillus karnatakaensis]|uniref:uncharacterized protein n=1 Tax=Aspergillus karnatakaensis TaxID=1810916 RepID=UPI003CCD1F94
MTSPVELMKRITFRSERDDLSSTSAPPPPSTLLAAIRPLLCSAVFVSNPKESDIQLYDAISQSFPIVFHDSTQFENHLSSTPKPHTRIVSICCKNSISPLRISETAMQMLLDKYDVDDTFTDLVASFGRKPRTADAGHGGMRVRERDDGSFDVQYRFTYPEPYGVRAPASFTSRQVAVFHRHSPSGTGNLWIFLHARLDSDLQSKLAAALSNSPTNATPHWFSLHLLVFATYIGNWRWYLREVGEKVDKAADIALGMDISSVELVSNDENLIRLLHPQYLGSTLNPLFPQLEVTLATVRKLAEINELFLSKGLSTKAQHRKLADEAEYYALSLEGYLRSLEAIRQRVHDHANCLTNALTLNNQARMLQLTDASVEDNTNVFVVTMVTMVYLPSSFVATFLGMNLFDFDSSEEKEFMFSRRFWIFFAAAVPLTCLTLGFWYFLTKRRRRVRKQLKPIS